MQVTYSGTMLQMEPTFSVHFFIVLIFNIKKCVYHYIICRAVYLHLPEPSLLNIQDKMLVKHDHESLHLKQGFTQAGSGIRSKETGNERCQSLHIREVWKKNIPDPTNQWKPERMGFQNRIFYHEKSKIMFQTSRKSN